MNSSYDILVAGGGVSGVAAAVTAGRSGAGVLLIERDGFLGGVGYSGLFQYICGLYLNGDAFPTVALNKGITSEIAALLNKLSPQKTIKKMGLVYVLPYSREDLLSVLNSLCYNEPDLTVLRNTTIVSVEKTCPVMPLNGK
ncbi:MAG: FAD-dependent oxidoreductase, partial [Deltaproteobacteria bacterium]|nr:FAD-dependent oxidoreductase [Deltaproteobacteria bacterium]